MKMKRIFTVLLTLCLIFSLTACGGTNTHSTTPEKTVDNEPSSNEMMSNLDIDHEEHGTIKAYDGKTLVLEKDDGKTLESKVSENVVLGKEPPEGRMDGEPIGAAGGPDKEPPPPKPEGEVDDDSVITKVGTLVTVGYDKDGIVIIIEMDYVQNMSETKGATVITKNNPISGTKYVSEGDNENALLVQKAQTSFDKITVQKLKGNSDNPEDSDTFGYNAAVLACDRAMITISNSTIESNAVGGNGIFAFGEKTKVEVKDTTIHTTKNNSGGIMVTNNGTIIASNLNIHTEGVHCAPIRSDHGGGLEQVDGGTYFAEGIDSPIIYATNAVNVSNIEGTATQSEAIVVVGAASVNVRNSTIISTKNAETGNSVMENVQGIMIYNSGPNRTHSQVTIADSNITINKGDTFYITNIATDLNLKNSTFTNNDPNAILMKIVGNSGSLGWGTAGKNGATATVTCVEQKLEGVISVDSISNLSLTLTDSNFAGQIIQTENKAATDGHGEIRVVLNENSTWKLTGDCQITELVNKGTIDFNGFTITLADGTVLSE